MDGRIQPPRMKRDKNGSMRTVQDDISREEDAAPVDMLASLFEARGWTYEFVGEDEIFPEDLAGIAGVPFEQKQVEMLAFGVVDQGARVHVATDLMARRFQRIRKIINQPELGMQQGNMHSKSPPQ